MKVGLNATCIANRPSGAQQRFLGLYKALATRLSTTEFVVFEPRDYALGSCFHGLPNVSCRRTPIASEGRFQRWIGNSQYWPRILESERFDFFESFNLPMVKSPTGRSILTVHDIRGLHTNSGVMLGAAHRMVLNKSLRSADHVITVSEAMKNDILSTFPGVPISVVNNGIDPKKFELVPHDTLQSTLQKYALPHQFILSVGHFEERKNYLNLIEATAQLRARGIACPLVIVGNDSGLMAAMESKIAALKLKGSVSLLGGLSDLEVRCLYKRCSLFVFPSRYEGFGIPILEAMAAECPMVLSDIPVFREITQGSSVYFPPCETELMALAIERVLSSSSERADQVNYGKERVKSFAFEKLAVQIEAIYASLDS